MPPTIDFTAFLSASDAERASRTLHELHRHRTESLVLTGGMAIEFHMLRLGLAAGTRPLNDIDFLAASFDDIPQTLSDGLLFRHVHPNDPPGKTMLQCVHPETAVRVDIFRAYGNTMDRAERVELCGASLRIISLEDLTARTARLCMDLAANAPIPAKHARDFLRLLPVVNLGCIDAVWLEHRKPNHPESFAAAAALLQDRIATRNDLQIVPVYSQDVHAACSRCRETEAFPLTGAVRIQSLLGYC
jgi:hypothetical protein